MFSRVGLMNRPSLLPDVAPARSSPSKGSNLRVSKATKNGLYVPSMAANHISSHLILSYRILLCSWLVVLQTEVNYLGQLHHPNLVKLIGYCSEGDNRLLVYEYLPKGSLENHLFRSKFRPPALGFEIRVSESRIWQFRIWEIRVLKID